jgi:hypothetical protein
MNIVELCKDSAAENITTMWTEWDQARSQWKADMQELRNYIFSTSTRTTTNAQLPWKNSTVTPKLTQIRDNLHANYIAALFPTDNWFKWESADRNGATLAKTQAITDYMRTKLKANGFELLISQLIYDYIDYGNVIVSYDYVMDVVANKAGINNKYTGPIAYRVSPLDIVFNPLAESFDKSPVIRRMFKSVGDLLVDIETKPQLNYKPEVVKKAIDLRKNFMADPENQANYNLAIDGFGSLAEYVKSDTVELLEFNGDYYDREAGKVMRNCIITIIDRCWVLREEANDDWTGGKPFFHCGWRLKPDNLWAQGPLAQLVGMQYRIDHLENLKADVFDLIAYPITLTKGNTVESFEWRPGENIHCGDEGNVEMLHPDTTALQADMQIEQLMQRMEELAGAPKQAMGIRTPGEKTKYEVQTLENAAGRIFQSKVSWFERNILEPLLNGMLAKAAANMDIDTVAGTDPEFNTQTFTKVTKEDLAANGKLYPVGARHFAEKARFVQELSTTVQTIQTIPSVLPHISGKQIARALEDAMGWKSYNIVKDNVFIEEQAETQRLMNQSSQDLAVENTIDPTQNASPSETI